MIIYVCIYVKYAVSLYIYIYIYIILYYSIIYYTYLDIQPPNKKTTDGSKP